MPSSPTGLPSAPSTPQPDFNEDDVYYRLVLVPKQMRMHTRTHAQMRMHTPSPLCIRTAMPTALLRHLVIPKGRRRLLTCSLVAALLRHLVIQATAANVRSKATDRDY